MFQILVCQKFSQYALQLVKLVKTSLKKSDNKPRVYFRIISFIMILYARNKMQLYIKIKAEIAIDEKIMESLFISSASNK